MSATLLLDELLFIFERDSTISSAANTKPAVPVITKSVQDDDIITTSTTNTSPASLSTATDGTNDEDEIKEVDIEDDMSEDEALRLALEMSMNADDHALVALIEREIRESQQHLSKWFNASFASVQDKNRAWCNFCKRLHHQFEMYRIEQGVIQPLSYQFFIQFVALMYGTMRGHHRSTDNDINIDQHKIKDIALLSADDDAVKYLRFKQGIPKHEQDDAIYAKFQSLAMDPTAPDEW
eukprot:CAMPEP_0202694904 /NCGR_PEP_ID=MMETSP1385-20130828/8641_1 /ASSEMBLY_ACC=CAM_ASM_000861 /TAXON_ID=933848 /ORGANISM="Elphidium margaritaceum" /LENGTH=237 /DNA_ID=CAMNT_0049350839 /DNA_START=30 /DNA_END=740 /DNA_ORIENTATION=-